MPYLDIEEQLKNLSKHHNMELFMFWCKKPYPQTELIPIVIMGLVFPCQLTGPSTMHATIMEMYDQSNNFK